MKKKKKKHAALQAAQIWSSPRALKEEAAALEKTLQELMAGLSTPKDTSRPQTQAAGKKEARPFPLNLGRHLLTRLTDLDAAAARLAALAERQGDVKTALRAVQVSVRVVAATVKLVDKHPHLGEGWQPPAADTRPADAAPHPAVSRTADQVPADEPVLETSQDTLKEIASPLGCPEVTREVLAALPEDLKNLFR